MDGTSRQRKTEQEIIQLLEDIEKSGAMTVKEFCEAYEISNATFYNWQKIYRSKSQNDDANGFVSLEVSASPFEEAASTLLQKLRNTYQHSLKLKAK